MSDNTKVFATRVMARHDWPTTVKQPRLVVVAKSRAAALRAFVQVIPNLTDGYLKDHGGETWNPAEIEAATSEPGTVFVETNEHPRAFAPLRPAAS